MLPTVASLAVLPGCVPLLTGDSLPVTSINDFQIISADVTMSPAAASTRPPSAQAHQRRTRSMGRLDGEGGWAA